MIVRKIALNGWRNYEFAAAEFSPGTNVITGENAQGKTNLLEVVERVSLIIDSKNNAPLRLTFRKDAIDFVCTTPLGKAADSCPCEGDGGDLEIGFNDHYLSDALKAAPAEEINVCLNTGSSPCILVPADGSDNFVYMVLPVRLRAGQ